MQSFSAHCCEGKISRNHATTMLHAEGRLPRFPAGRMWLRVPPARLGHSHGERGLDSRCAVHRAGVSLKGTGHGRPMDFEVLSQAISTLHTANTAKASSLGVHGWPHRGWDNWEGETKCSFTPGWKLIGMGFSALSPFLTAKIKR
jgi:hypothetical protein